MDLIIIVLVLAVIVLQTVILLRKPKTQDTSPVMESIRQELDAGMHSIGAANLDALERVGNCMLESQRNAASAQGQRLDELGRHLSGSQTQLQSGLNGQFVQLQNGLNAQLETMRQTMAQSLDGMREENSRKLEEIRGTVDEKLQTTLEKRIAESFRSVSEQLEQVYRGLGEMQTLAGDVGGLKKVLSGVKTRGILGEIQLAAILEEILTPEQYDTNVATIPGSTERVEFAVRLPQDDEKPLYLPIDSKFPGERYAQLLDAKESGDRAAIETAYRALEQVLCSEAKDIRTKYVSVPYTTGFGIMFLPFEGLYAEVVNRGLVEKLQREYQINIAGPSTMAALLNSLQMGFRTLALQKRSAEVWKVLGAVKTEFEKFDDLLLKMQNHLQLTAKDLDSLMGTRTRAIRRQLREVQRLEEPAAKEILGLEEPEPADDFEYTEE